LFTRAEGIQNFTNDDTNRTYENLRLKLKSRIKIVQSDIKITFKIKTSQIQTRQEHHSQFLTNTARTHKTPRHLTLPFQRFQTFPGLPNMKEKQEIKAQTHTAQDTEVVYLNFKNT
jgi:hypothetical protein